MVDGELCSVTDEEEHNDDDLDEVEVIQRDDGDHAIFRGILDRLLLTPKKPATPNAMLCSELVAQLLRRFVM